MIYLDLYKFLAMSCYLECYDDELNASSHSCSFFIQTQLMMLIYTLFICIINLYLIFILVCWVILSFNLTTKYAYNIQL